MQSAQVLQLRPSPLVGAQPEFGWERFGDIVRELPPLFARHWQELALNRDMIPLSPDWEKYMQLDHGGVLGVVTARVDGVLVGYAFMLVGPHLHYVTTTFGHVEMFWLAPEYRTGWTGVHLFQFLIRKARGLGVRVLHVPVKHHFMGGRVSSLMKRLGFGPIETVWSKVL